jgi:dolichol-phosphate mannosyltransferase
MTARGGSPGGPAGASAVALSVILPTRNEAENLPEVIPRLERALADLPHEIIVVDDDSADRTWEVARRLAATHRQLSVIRRMSRRGLSSAVLEGFLAARGEVLAVADADGQHDFALLPDLYAAVRAGANVAVGSRYVSGGSLGALDPRRRAMSRMATRLARLPRAVRVEDPLSGFFATDRTTFETSLPALNPRGFKILLDILLHLPPEAVVHELPFVFGARRHGRSKLSRRVQIEFLESVYDATVGRWVPLTLVKYCAVSACGHAVHRLTEIAITWLFAVPAAPASFDVSIAEAAAIQSAIAFNFALNNVWTFGHARLRGARATLGFLTFNAVCLLGLLAHYGVSDLLSIRGFPEAWAVGLGTVAGVGWNYAVNRAYTWWA